MIFFNLELDEKEEIQVKACQALSAIESFKKPLTSWQIFQKQFGESHG